MGARGSECPERSGTATSVLGRPRGPAPSAVRRGQQFKVRPGKSWTKPHKNPPGGSGSPRAGIRSRHETARSGVVGGQDWTAGREGVAVRCPLTISCGRPKNAFRKTHSVGPTVIANRQETTHPQAPNSRAIAAKIPGKWLAPGQVDDSCMPSPIVDP